MPRTRSKAATQKKAIESRLIEMSVLIDYYIHRGKPISEQEAEVYLDEIADFKTKCMGDARLIQVIDRISRSIKTALDEQESFSQMEVPPFQSTDYTNINQSPGYSMSDVDITKDTQDISKTAQDIPNATHNIPKVTQNIPKATQNIPKSALNNTKSSQDIVGATQHIIKTPLNIPNATQNIPKVAQNILISRDTQNIRKTTKKSNERTIENIDDEIIDLCENEEDITYNQQYIDVEMNRAFSDLSLNETVPMSMEFECSQSIIEDYTQDNTTAIPENQEKNYNDDCKEIQVFKKAIVPEQCHKTLREYPRKEMSAVNINDKENIIIKANKTEVSDSKLKKTRKRQTKINTTAIAESQEKNVNDDCKEIQSFKKAIVPEQCLKTLREYPRKEMSDVNINDKENRNIKANETEVSDSKLKKPRKRKTKNSDFLVESNQKEFQKKTTNTDMRDLEKATDSGITKKIKRKYTKPTKKNTINKSQDGKIATKDIRSFFAVQKNNESKSLNKSIDPVSEPKSTTVKNTAILEKPSPYNSKVLDDLSWMENVRFVREIATDEYDPSLGSLEDSFWDNCMLPFLEDEDFTIY